MNDKQASENYMNWKRLYDENKLKFIKDEPEISIFIEKKIDTIQIKLMGISNQNELQRIMILLECILSIYHQKYISKTKLNKSL